MFRAVSLSIIRIRSLALYTKQFSGIFYYFNFLYNIEFYLKHVLQFNCNVHVYTLVILPIFGNFSMTYTIAVCTVLDSWWWTESKQSAKLVWHIPIAVCTVLDSWWWTQWLFETFTCRILIQKLIWDISATRFVSRRDEVTGEWKEIA